MPQAHPVSLWSVCSSGVQKGPLPLPTCPARQGGEAVLALLQLGLHEGNRAWKGFDWEAMQRLHAKGYISAPVGQAKSVVFTDAGLRESERLLRERLGR